MSEPLVTILVPHYKTLELTKLCLRLLRKHTDLTKARVIVIDVHSYDESSEYLKTIKWIDLIESENAHELKEINPPEHATPAKSHNRALDTALKLVTTPYVLSIHTDTLVKRPDWIDFLINKIEQNNNIAAVGSWKLEVKPLYKRVAKSFEKQYQLLWYKLIGKKQHGIQGVGDNFFYLRSHCALYKMDLIKKYDLTFGQGWDVAGRQMHKSLVDHGHEMVFLESQELNPYVEHLNHATKVLNPELGSRNKTIRQGLKSVQKGFQRVNAEAILADSSLDN